MTILESQFEQVAGDIDAGEVPHYAYDVKFSIVMKERLETIPGKAFLTKTMKALKNTIKHGEVLELFDVDNTQVEPDLSDVHAEDIGNKFCVEIGGRDSKIFMFGAKIQSTVSYAVLKQRTDAPLKARSTYISLHRGGFNYGVNWVPLGFFVGKHPKFVNQEALRIEILDKFATGWMQDSEYWTPKKKAEIQKAMNTKAARFDPSSIPLVITSMNTAASTDTKTIRTYTVTVTAPRQLSRTGRSVMDYLLLRAKTLPQYVPLGFKTEDPTGFQNILNSHETWLENHRNIQINNIPSTAHYVEHLSTSRPNGPTTLAKLLASIPHVLDVNYDPIHSRLNVSVDKTNFARTSNTLAEELKATTFDFQPTVRKIYTTASSPMDVSADASVHTTTTKYSQILSDIVSAANSLASTTDDRIAQRPPHSNPWKTIPSTIYFYTTSSDDFPPLAQIHTTAAIQPQSDNNSDSITVSTLQSTIHEALAELQRQHNAELKAMREDHRAELEDIRKAFQAEISTSLKEQLAQLDHPSNKRLEDKIDTLMYHFHLKTWDKEPILPATPSKSPHRKKSRHQEHSIDEDAVSPSTPGAPDAMDMDRGHVPRESQYSGEDENVPSSQDGARVPSGSEH